MRYVPAALIDHLTKAPLINIGSTKQEVKFSGSQSRLREARCQSNEVSEGRNLDPASLSLRMRGGGSGWAEGGRCWILEVFKGILMPNVA